MDALRVLNYLRNKYKKENYKAALVGSYKDGKYVEPPALQTDSTLFYLPLALSVVPVFTIKDAVAQWVAGVAVILASYLLLYAYLKKRCFMPDVVKVVRTNHPDVEHLKRNKLRILEDPHSLEGDYEVYYAPVNVCVVRDKRANAFTLDGPRGPLVYFTTGLYARLSPEEAQAVLEHEMGHIKARHTYKLLTFLVAEYTLRLPLVHLVYAKLTVVLLALHLLGVTLLFTALLQAFEYEADRLAAARHRDLLASALVKLDWNGIVEALANPLMARLSILARTHPLTVDRLRKINALPF
ncbi:MAG: M48 family metallopeptidase [Pyrobaculum sp.]